MEWLIGLGALLVGFAAAWLIFKKSSNTDTTSEIVRKVELLENTFKNVNEMTLKHIGEIKSDVAKDLKTNRETIDSSSRTMHQQISHFTQSITKMEGNLRNVFDSIKTSNDKMSSFQDMFKTPKLRGEWGQSNLKYELEQTYSNDRVLAQHYFKSGEAVDFVLKLPNDLLLPIDSKFPMEVFKPYWDELIPIEKVKKQQIFVQAVKKEVDSVASKYINPGESTVDFALIYVPAEAVFYEIMFSMKDDGLMEYAHKKRVRFVSPNTLRMTLSVIEHWVRDITVNKETKEILKRLSAILQDGKKLADSYRVLGKHISNVQSAYTDSGDRLRLLTGRVENVISIGANESQNQEALVNSKLALGD
ncbi:DNA recombination protein RmuC [Candidatus Kaiserbacteria bacterium]|nr:DNA recombination protein RmuC [Candidatus Kaiserbacteria bacterium]